MNKLLMILQMIPTIVSLVQHAETVFPGGGQGQKKLNLVLSNVSAAASAVPEVSQALSSADLEKAVTVVATATVNALNSAGVFKTKPAAQAAAK